MSKDRFTNQQVMFKEGGSAEKLFIIREGEVLCLKSSKDRLLPVFLAKKGDIIGESAMLKNISHSYSAISMGNTEVVEIESTHFHQVFDSAPEWIKQLMTNMLHRLQDTASLIAENRIIHNSIVNEAFFTPQLEIEYKKLLSQ